MTPSPSSSMAPSAPPHPAGPEEVRPCREQGPPAHHPPLPARPGCGPREGCSDEVTGQFVCFFILTFDCFEGVWQGHFPFVVQPIVNISVSNDVLMQKSINVPHWRGFKPSVYTNNCWTTVLSVYFKLGNWYLQIFFTSILSFFQQWCSLWEAMSVNLKIHAEPLQGLTLPILLRQER